MGQCKTPMCLLCDKNILSINFDFTLIHRKPTILLGKLFLLHHNSQIRTIGIIFIFTRSLTVPKFWGSDLRIRAYHTFKEAIAVQELFEKISKSDFWRPKGLRDLQNFHGNFRRNSCRKVKISGESHMRREMPIQAWQTFMYFVFKSIRHIGNTT